LIGSIKLDSKTLQKIQDKNSTLPRLHRRKKSRASLHQAVTSDTQKGTTDLPPHVVLSGGSVTKEEQEWVCSAH
jgi:hypothetical protein